MIGDPVLRFGFLGPAGTFTEAALRTLPATATAELVPFPSVVAALDGVRSGAVHATLVPFENSVEGSVPAVLDDLASGTALQVVGEVILPVSFALLARPGLHLADIREVATHPHAEAQCRGWLRAHLPHARVVLTASTADAARAVAAGEYAAAIAAPLAGALYDLAVLAAEVQDNEDAVTRFVLVAQPGPPPAPTGADRTTLVVEIADHPGALLEVLTEFAVRGINLTRIESRPTGGGLGRYSFSMDCEGHLADARVGEALSALHRLCAEVRVLGSYPRADGLPTTLRTGTADRDFTDAASWLARVRAGR